MISLKQFNKLKENNTLEVKQAINGIPNSLWETYSSFCNSYGGTILLGVKEEKSLKPVGLNESQIDLLIKSFWDTINNSNKISVNLLSDNNVLVHKIQNSYIIEIKVPQASKNVKPVYINNNPLLAYRRNYQGDYKCTKEEIFSMYRDQDNKSNDSYLVNLFTIDVLNKDSIQKYRIYFEHSHEKDHPFIKTNDDLFLINIGAAGYDEKGIIRPTRAGLLMFGNSYDICREYSNYFLDYQDHRNLQDQYMRWSNRIISDYGDWSGNIFDFFNRITLKLTEDIPVPFKMKGIYRDDIVPMKKAIREALCNTLCNADYHQSVGLVIKQYSDKIVFSNPGILTMPINEILQGGTSKPRNKTLLKMFNLINIGERAGSGIPLIMQTTKEEKYPKPIIYDRFNPDITYFTIFIKNLGNNDEILGNNDEILGNNDEILGNNDEILGNNDNESVNSTIKKVINDLQLKTDAKEKLLIITNYFNDKIFGNCDIQKYLSCNKNTATFYIKILKEADLIISISGYGKGKYKFKKTDS